MTDLTFRLTAAAILRRRLPHADQKTIEAEVQAVAARIKNLRPAGHDADGRAYVRVSAVADCFGVPVEDIQGLLELIPPSKKRLEEELYRMV